MSQLAFLTAFLLRRETVARCLREVEGFYAEPIEVQRDIQLRKLGALLDFARDFFRLRREQPLLRMHGDPGPVERVWLAPDGRELNDRNWLRPEGGALGLCIRAGSHRDAEALLLPLSAPGRPARGSPRASTRSSRRFSCAPTPTMSG